MGRPTWVLLPHAPDWRWLLDREDSPWYACVKLYRQGEDRQWAGVLGQVIADLSEHIQTEPKNLATLLQQAFALHQQGQLAEAKVLYEQVLAQQPRNFDALHLSGVLAGQCQDFALAAERIGQAIEVNPAHASAHNARGKVLQALNRWDEALTSFDKAIALKPDFTEAHFNRGLALRALKRLDEALSSFDRAIASKPDYAQAFNSRGNVLQSLNRLEEALTSYAQAIAIQPDYAEAYNNRGNVMQALKRFDDAISSYDQAIAIRSDHAEAHNNRGGALKKLVRLEEALSSFNRALAIRPDYADAHNNRGAVLQDLKRWEDALASCDRAIAFLPDFSDAYSNRGIVLGKLGRLDEALISFRRAITLQPEHVYAYNSRGIVLQELERWDEALADFARALEIKPDYEFLLGTLMYIRSQMCEWQSYDQDRQHLQTQLKQRQKVSPPFAVVTLFDDLALQKSAAEVWVQAHHAASSPLGSITHTRDHTSPHPRKIRLAYYSADFHNHATAYLMAQLFECHDRELFELYAFSFGPDTQDGMRQRLVTAFDHFIDVRSDSDQAIAQRSRELGIDIAVDLKGYTGDSRPGIFACRCAPVQVNYLGYPGTMGAPFMDYLIADKVVIPPESQEHYSENIVYLPHSYQVNDGHREIASTVWRKTDLGLPEEGFVFCCFNNSYKITPQTFASWMRILQAVPASVLWLLGDNATAQRNLQQHAQAAGIDPSRLVFAPRMPLAEHLARHRAADLFLDTLPCNAHTTASDALWAGLPVLTQQGQSFAARVAASLLTAVGLPELIVHTAQEYEDTAIALAQDTQRLEHIKQKLAEQRDTAPLFNTKQLARHIEQAYAAMHARAQAGLAAQGFEVAGSHGSPHARG
jgi:predicted O-linked N-acetylglucosamine transferase (SPINDLY family)